MSFEGSLVFQCVRSQVDSKIDVQPLWKEPRRVVEEFAVGEDEDTSKKTMVSVNWVISEGKDDLETSLALQPFGMTRFTM